MAFADYSLLAGNSFGGVGDGITSANQALSSSSLSGLNGLAGNGQTTELGWNTPTLGLGLSTLSSLGSLWSALQSNNLAKAQFDYTKKTTDTNLANSVKSYNTSLADKINARASVTGMSDQAVSDYLAKNSLST